MKRNILITGGAGFIGSNFVRYWAEKYSEDFILILDALTYAGNLENLHGLSESNIHFEKNDILNTNKVTQLLEKHAIDTVVHFAAESHVDRSIESPDVFLSTNILGTHSLLKGARNAWNTLGINGHFHHVSTDEVYGDLQLNDPAFSETTPYAPNSPYSASKASSDFLVRAYFHTYGMNVTTSNCSNNYGPYHFPEKLIPLTILNVLHGKAIPVYGNGKNIRDWLYVDDHSLGIDLIINNGRMGETYNVGGLNEWTNIDIVSLICNFIDDRFRENGLLKDKYPQCPAAIDNDSKSLIKYVQDRSGHDFRYAIDATKITTELGYKPQYKFEDGIKKTIDWYIENEFWWANVLDGSYQKTQAV